MLNLVPMMDIMKEKLYLLSLFICNDIIHFRKVYSSVKRINRDMYKK